MKEITNTPITAEEIRRESLRLNKRIIIGNKEAKWTRWYENGISIIHDIVNENGIFHTKLQMERKYKVKCDKLQYNALKNAIPQQWRRQIKKPKIKYEDII